MRKRYRVLLIASLVAVLAGQLGYALAVQPPSVVHKSTAAPTASTVVVAPVLVRGGAAPTGPMLNPVPSAGKLLIVGTFLFGLSALVRRAR